MSAENRLTAEQLAALGPGDLATIESGAEFGRRRQTTATVARITARHVVVRCGAYIECYGLRDGMRDGGGGRAELVDHVGHERTTSCAARCRNSSGYLLRRPTRALPTRLAPSLEVFSRRGSLQRRGCRD